MISSITGTLVRVVEAVARLDVGVCTVDVLVPLSAESELAAQVGRTVALETVCYLEGNAVGANFTPRLLGFLTESDREFFVEFTRVKGIGMRKALRAMSVPAHQIAAAVESGDDRALSRLPEIGKKTALQMVTDLRGKLARFVLAGQPQTPPRVLSDAQRLAVEILVGWGDRRSDAERLVASVAESEPVSEPDEIVKAVYRLKAKAR